MEILRVLELLERPQGTSVLVVSTTCRHAELRTKPKRSLSCGVYCDCYECHAVKTQITLQMRNLEKCRLAFVSIRRRLHERWRFNDSSHKLDSYRRNSFLRTLSYSRSSTLC